VADQERPSECPTCGSREPLIDYLQVKDGRVPHPRAQVAEDWRCPDPFHSASPEPVPEQERCRDPVEHLCWYETIREPELEARISELAGEVERIATEAEKNRHSSAYVAKQLRSALAEGSRDG
jgi:hypothetical protein